MDEPPRQKLRGWKPVTVVITGVVATALAIYFMRGPPGVVTVGKSFADSKTNPTLRPSDPLRVLLALPSALSDNQVVDFELHHGGHPLLMYTIPDQRRHDELYVSWKTVSQVVKGRTGVFRVRFVKQGTLLGEGTFTVAP